MDLTSILKQLREELQAIDEVIVTFEHYAAQRWKSKGADVDVEPKPARIPTARLKGARKGPKTNP